VVHLALSVIISSLVVAPEKAGAQSTVPKEYQIKAAFLFNFAQFVQWPAAAFPEADLPIRIGILGQNPFGEALKETIRGESIRGHRLVVQHSQQLDDLKNCHLVFICKSERERLHGILANLREESVLTVSDIDGFARGGGAIGFYLDGKKVRFEINLAAAQRQKLKISSQLLGLGKIVEGGTE
jgi:hypothetical protein